MKFYIYCIIIIFQFISLKSFSQLDTLNNKKNYTTPLIVSEAAAYSISMVGLYNVWYKDYPLSKFHFFNDNNGWNTLDKFGHAFTCYHLGRFGTYTLDLAGANRNTSTYLGGTEGLIFMTSVEIFDGLSKEWGFSPGDFIANLSGSGFYIFQNKLWQEQRIKFRFSYHKSFYSDLRPDKLGSAFLERLIKDYNGQAYWLSFNINKLCKIEKIPNWLFLSIGYGADGMLTGYNNPEIHNGKSYPVYKQYYLSLDIDLTQIPIKNKFLKHFVFTLFDCVKFPLPTLEFNTLNGFKFHPLYF